MKPCKIPQNKTTCGIFKKGRPLNNCKKRGARGDRLICLTQYPPLFKTIICITAKQLQHINLSVKTFIQINLPLIVLCILISLEFFEKYAHSYKMIRKHAKRAQRVILLDAYNSEM